MCILSCNYAISESLAPGGLVWDIALRWWLVSLMYSVFFPFFSLAVENELRVNCPDKSSSAHATVSLKKNARTHTLVSHVFRFK